MRYLQYKGHFLGRGPINARVQEYFIRDGFRKNSIQKADDSSKERPQIQGPKDREVVQRVEQIIEERRKAARSLELEQLFKLEHSGRQKH